jgi:cell division cycle 2-like protein
MQAVRDGFPKHFLCEINILSCTKHRNLLALREVVLGGSGEPGDGGVFLVLDWMEADMQGLVRDMTRSLRPAEIKCLLRQLLKGVRALDRACIMHRDLKPANLLYNNDNGRLVICDLGEARRYADGDDTESRTPGVMSLRYRAPEVLLGDPHYTLAVDMWSAGGIFAKLVAGHDLLPATTEMELVQMMLSCFGTPTEETWPGFEKLPMANELKLAAAPTGGHLSERFTTTEASGTHKVTPAETPVEKGTEDSQKEGRPDAVPAPLSTPTPATAPTPVDAISIAQTIDAGSATGEQVPKESVLDSFFAEMEEFGEGGEGDNKAKEGAKTAAEEGGQEEQGPVHEGKKVISSEEEKEKPVSVGAALPFLSTLGLDLLTKMLRYDPSKRITAGEALQHAYFMEEPRALPRSLMPKLPC